MEVYKNQLSALNALSEPLERLNQEIEQIQQAIAMSDEIGRSLEKGHPETYSVRMAVTRDLQEHLSNKITERDLYFKDLKQSIHEAVSKKLQEIQ